MKVLKKIFLWLDNNLEEKVMMVLLMAMTLIMGLQVFSRYVLNNSLTWTEEMTRFLFVWMTFLSIGYCTSKGISLKIDQFVNVLPAKVRHITRIAVYVVSIAFFIYIIPGAFEYAMTAVSRGQKSSAMGINMVWVQSSTVVGFVLGLIRTVQGMVKETAALIKGEPSVEDKPAEVDLTTQM